MSPVFFFLSVLSASTDLIKKIGFWKLAFPKKTLYKPVCTEIGISEISLIIMSSWNLASDFFLSWARGQMYFEHISRQAWRMEYHQYNTSWSPCNSSFLSKGISFNALFPYGSPLHLQSEALRPSYSLPPHSEISLNLLKAYVLCCNL